MGKGSSLVGEVPTLTGIGGGEETGSSVHRGESVDGIYKIRGGSVSRG